MSKYDTFGAYPSRSLLSAETALLTVWPSLSQYHDDLVLVGGLAIHYLTRRDLQGLPGAITLDVDLGISLAASGGQYGTIKSDLEGLGFVSESQRLVRKRGTSRFTSISSLKTRINVPLAPGSSTRLLRVWCLESIEH